jgi:hypothetical protein
MGGKGTKKKVISVVLLIYIDIKNRKQSKTGSKTIAETDTKNSNPETPESQRPKYLRKSIQSSQNVLIFC